MLVWKLALFPLLSSEIHKIASFLCFINMSLMLWLQTRTITYYDCSRRQQRTVVRRPMRHLMARLPVCQTLPGQERNFCKVISRNNCNREDSSNAMSSTYGQRTARDGQLHHSESVCRVQRRSSREVNVSSTVFETSVTAVSISRQQNWQEL
jgi:hypothetical protein